MTWAYFSSSFSEFKGFIMEIKPVQNLSDGRRLLKFVISNGNKKVYALLWNELIEKHGAELQINRVLYNIIIKNKRLYN